MELLKTPLIGCDPEFFVQLEGVNVSAHELVKGTKEKPLKLERGAVQVDGTALEFNIDPAENEKAFIENIDLVLKQVRELIPADYKFDFSAVARYGAHYIDALPDYAKELGCDPDFNAYYGTQNAVPDAAAGFRTGAGHIHIGLTQGADISHQPFIVAMRQLVAMVDLYVGLPLALIEPDNERSQLYGGGGAYRPKSYGVEWRSGSNFWLTSMFLRRMVYRQTLKAYKAVMQNKHSNFSRWSSLHAVLNSVRMYKDHNRGWYIKEIIKEAGNIYPKPLLIKMEQSLV